MVRARLCGLQQASPATDGAPPLTRRPRCLQNRLNRQQKDKVTQFRSITGAR